VHRQTSRSAGPFLTLGCTAVPESLFESEVLGYEQGTFTGSSGGRQGLYEMATGGTLFLDEIGETPQALQTKLLRVLETGEYRRVGGRKTLCADVRLVCATNRRLSDMVRQLISPMISDVAGLARIGGTVAQDQLRSGTNQLEGRAESRFRAASARPRTWPFVDQSSGRAFHVGWPVSTDRRELVTVTIATGRDSRWLVAEVPGRT